MPRHGRDDCPSAREAALAATEAGLAKVADDTSLLFERAALLDGLGRAEEAQRAYLDLLRRAPTHADGLINLGSLLGRRGYRRAARLLYAEAIRHHPTRPAGHVNLAHLLHEAGELLAARRHYETALAHAPSLAEAHQGLANVLDDLGEHAAARFHREQGWRGRAVVARPYRGVDAPVRVLLVISAAGGNIPTAFFLDDTVFKTTVLAAEFFAPDGKLPAHDLVLNGIGDADRCRLALAAAARIARASAAPVINPPARVGVTGRLKTAASLGTIAGLCVPSTARIRRAELAGPNIEGWLAARGFAFPMLLRAPGFHTGRHFMRIEALDELAVALAALPGETLLAIRLLDARDGAGLYRKYRVMLIDGKFYPLHLAISRCWKVHYFTAEMAENASFRAEEARFLSDMAAVLGPRAMAALAAIRDRLGLDYAGVDFALGPAGEMLLFEANAAMAIVPPDADPRWDYRRPAIERALAAVRRMLTGRAVGVPRAASDQGCSFLKERTKELFLRFPDPAP